MKDLLITELEDKGFSYSEIDQLTQNISNMDSKQFVIQYLDRLITITEEARKIIRKNY